jgi:hypothetical protein
MPNQILQNSRVDLLSVRNLDFKGRQIKNAGNAVDPQDYVTLSQLRSLNLSAAVNPVGVDNSSWTPYVPITIGILGGGTTISTDCAFKQIGKTVFVRISFVVAISGLSAYMTVSLPTVPTSDNQTFAFSYINPTVFNVGACQAYGAGPVINLYPVAGGNFAVANCTVWINGVYETK